MAPARLEGTGPRGERARTHHHGGADRAVARTHLRGGGGGRARSRHSRTHVGGGGPRRAGPVVRSTFSAADQAAISAADAAIVVAGLTSADEGEGLVT